jgi:enoyl-CoA hydratase/carnithine racemase
MYLQVDGTRAGHDAMTEPPLLISDKDGAVTLTLNRPDKLNAISYELMVLLRDQLDQLAERRDLICVVLAGSGRSFSAGFDIGSLAHESEKLRFMAATIDALEMFPRPVIARVHGHCLTGALELVLACDIIVASDDATFADTHSRYGIVPVCGLSVRLPERIGAEKAKLLGFSGRRIDAATALTWGLVDLSVPRGELEATIEELVVDVRSNSADAHRILKALIRHGASSGLERQEKLDGERELIFGVPEDRLERLADTGR